MSGDLAQLLGGDDDARTVAALPDVDAAYASGAQGLRLHAAIAAARRRAPPHERGAIDAVLVRRRAFVEPIAAAPTMFTLNGIGSRLYGAAERGRDGTSIATLFATFVFVPLFPLASYLVRFSGGRSWSFFGRVPLSRAHRTWRWGALAAAVLAVAWGASTVHHRATHARVQFVNGLDVPVTTRFGDTTVSVAAGDVEARDVPAGRHHVVTTSASGEPVEEFDVDVPAAKDLVIYNVLGAAPAEIAVVVYGASRQESGASELGTDAEDLSGERFVVRDPVAFVFETPPDTLRMRSARELRRHAMIAKGGWKASVSNLLRRGEVVRAADLARRIALFERTDDAIETAAAVVSGVDASLQFSFAETAIARAPESVTAHRVLQDALRRLGRIDEARARYRAEFEKSPSSARAGYLFARVLPTKEAAPIVDRLLKDHPDDRWLLRARGWAQFQARQFSAAAESLERLASVDTESAAAMLSIRARALAASGRTPEAQQLVRVSAAAGDWPALLLYTQLARLPGASPEMPDVAELLTSDSQQASKAAVRAILAAGARDEAEFRRDASAIDDADTRTACRLQVLAFENIDAAAQEQATASSQTLSMLDDETALALVCDLLRRGEAPRAKVVYAAAVSHLGATLALDRLSDPVAALADEELDLSLRACLELAAARRAPAEVERDRWIAEASADDVLRIVVKR